MLPPRLECATALCPGTDGPTAHLVSGALRYMHYGSQGFADHGWGCGFRTVCRASGLLLPNPGARQHSPPPGFGFLIWLVRPEA